MTETVCLCVPGSKYQVHGQQVGGVGALTPPAAGGALSSPAHGF